jgi:hypothetical protein
MERELKGEADVIKENPTQCHFVHHKNHMRSDLGLYRNLSGIRLAYGTLHIKRMHN